MKLQSVKGLEDSPGMKLVSMEIDSVLQSNLKNLANPRKRNADRFLRKSSDEPTVITPSEASRTSAKLRLSVSRKQRATSEDEIVQPISEEFPLTDKKRALFEPLGPSSNGRPVSPESLLPPPDFDSASYPRGWLVGKKRKLVNVDVVESMRRIAVHEMNRKDREIDGLNEQLEEDARTMEHLQLQLQQERAKRNQVERENAVLQEQIGMLVNMINEGEPEDTGEIDG